MKESASEISSVVEEVTLISFIENLGEYTRGLVSVIGWGNYTAVLASAASGLRTLLTRAEALKRLASGNYLII